ncbi:MAG: class I SAM-dependent methyltransferase [Leptospiraceae bacterium]|nr:class I SAM-dependent methyltransferase [Leptospiraceae bacterium]
MVLIVSILTTAWVNFPELDLFVFRDSNQVTENTLSYSELGSGLHTLETIEEANLYNKWLASKIEDYLGEKNLELGAGTGTIANILSRDYNLELFELSEYNQKILKTRFQNSKNISNIFGDILQNQNWNYYNCIYSSNVLEHIPNDEEIVLHCFKLLAKGGYFVAIVPAMKILYSEFDKKIGHFRRYTKQDVSRIVSRLVAQNFSVKVIHLSLFNPIGAIGWFLKMKVLRKQEIDPKDAMFMNSLVPFVA